MDQLLRAMAIFIAYPLLAALVGVFLLGLGRLTRRRTAIVVGWLWLLYAAYEMGMHQRWFCSGECNIRIDLLAIYPGLLIGSLVAFVSVLRGPKKIRPTT
jgi:formate hydrogenlyase subunit 3/multisubunit Na+/H+ antiporter MnhD subunit